MAGKKQFGVVFVSFKVKDVVIENLMEFMSSINEKIVFGPTLFFCIFLFNLNPLPCCRPSQIFRMIQALKSSRVLSIQNRRLQILHMLM